MRKLVLFNLSLSIMFVFCSCTQTEGVLTEKQTSPTIVETLETTDETNATIEETTVPTVEETTAVTTTEEPLELVDYDISNVVFTPWEEYSGIEFMTEEQQKAFWLAGYINMMFDFEVGMFWDYKALPIPKPRYEDMHILDSYFYHTGFTYGSVIQGFESVLSEDILSEIMEGKCADYNGEYVSSMGFTGSNPAFTEKMDFQFVSSDESKLEFKVIAYFADPATNASATKEYEYEMVKIDENWILTKFDMWWW